MKRLSNIHPDRARREAVLARIEQLTELPLLLLSFAMIPLLLGPMLWEMPPDQEAIFISLDWFIWAIFAVDLAVKLAVAPERWAYIRRHWLDVLVVAIPFARPLRILRLFVFGSRAITGARKLASLEFLLVYWVGLIVITSTAVTVVEVGQERATISSFPDALWWAVVTAATVGYGDEVPVTAAGRAIGFVLMIGGIALFGALTANLASFLVRTDDPNKAALTQLLDEVKGLREELARLRESQDQSNANPS